MCSFFFFFFFENLSFKDASGVRSKLLELYLNINERPFVDFIIHHLEFVCNILCLNYIHFLFVNKSCY